MSDRVVRIEAGAVELLAAVGDPRPAVSALALADAFGLAVKRGFPGLPPAVAAALRGRLVTHRQTVEVSEDLAGRALHDAVAHELGHWALVELGMPVSVVGADRMAAALMMPVTHIGGDMDAPLDALLERHVYCSLRLIDVRLRSYACLFCPAAERAS